MLCLIGEPTFTESETDQRVLLPRGYDIVCHLSVCPCVRDV